MDRRTGNNSDKDLASWIINVLIEEYEHQFGVKCTYREVNVEEETA